MESTKPDSYLVTDRDILLRLEGKFDAHLLSYTKDQVVIHQELGQRPRRAEILSWLGAAGVVSGVFFGLVNVLM